MRDSIRRLCVADRQNDPAKIKAWLANKTPAEFRLWLVTPGQSLLVAEEEEKLAGVGLIDDHGALLLLYVHPDSRGAGVGLTWLRVLETRAWERGAKHIELRPTVTARGFCLRFGYVPISPASPHMQKTLIGPETAGKWAKAGLNTPRS